MMAAGPADVPAVHVGFFPPRPGTPATNPWLVFAFMGWLTRVVAWIAVTWQRIRPSGGAMPNTITVPLADVAQAAADPEKVLVNALRAAHRVACGLVRWLVARTTVCPASVVVTIFRVPSYRSTSRYGHRSGRSGSNGSGNPEAARGNGSRSAIGSKSLRDPGNRDSKINNPPNREICCPPAAQ